VWRLDGPKEIVIVDRGRAATWDGRDLTEITIPLIENQVVVLDPAKPFWCDFDQLRANLHSVRGNVAIHTAAELHRLFACWPWRHPSDALVATGLALATWVQTLWEHRPVVFITGPSCTDTPDLFYELLEPFFGALAFRAGGDVAWADRRQFLGNTACAILLEDIEQSPRRARVMEMLRTGVRGGCLPPGRPNRRGTFCGLRHIPWVLATEGYLRREQDRSRFIIMELRPWSSEAPSRLDLPGRAAVGDLGGRCLAVGLNYFDRAAALYRVLSDTQVLGVPRRLIEPYSVPAAMLAAVRGLDPDGAQRLLVEMIGRRFAPSLEPEDLLRDILGAVVPVGRGRTLSVHEIINLPHADREAREALERHGVALVQGRRGPRTGSTLGLPGCKALFVNVSAVQKHLLGRDQRWARQDIDGLLLRLPGARRAQHTVAGGRGRGIEIPAAAVLEISADISGARSDGGLSDGGG
jgi:hypothetical protein